MTTEPTTEPRAARRDVYGDTTARIVEMLETGAADPMAWRRTWRTIGAGQRSAVGRPYAGINVLALTAAQIDRGYEHGVWATFQQWRTIGASVRKGERACRAVLWRPYESSKVDESTGETETRRGVMLRDFAVFNVAQVDPAHDATDKQRAGLARLASGPEPINADTAHAAAETWIAATGARIDHGGDRACYVPAADRIRLPRFADFETGGAYYATAAHELTHWTGHPDRCARDLSGRFGTASYAAEELVAEIGAAFAMARLGLDAEPRADHAHYIASWIQLLRGDDRAIFTAAAKAEQATKFLFGETAAETAAA